MEKESYIPSPEELSQAESTMTGLQKDMSRRREEMLASLKNKGIEGVPLVKIIENPKNPNDRSGFIREMTGTINGQEIKIQLGYNPGRAAHPMFQHEKKTHFIKGTIDGRVLSPAEGQKLLDDIGTDFTDLDILEKASENTKLEIEGKL